MAHDSAGRRDSGKTADALGQGASAVAGAGSEFLARAVELIGRQISEAVAQALKPAGSSGSESRLDSLLARYRDALGELAFHLPMVARRLVRTYEEPPGGPRWLFRATLDENRPKPEGDPPPGGEAFAMPRLQVLKQMLPAEPPEPTIRVFLTEETGASFSKRFKDELGADPAVIAEAISLATEDGQVRDLPNLFDRLKYEFRRNGYAALPGIQKDVAWLQADSLLKACAFVEELKLYFGEACARELLVPEVLATLATGAELLSPSRFRELETAFAFAGIALPDRITVVAERRRWLILDHDADRVFEGRLRTLPDQKRQATEAATDKEVPGKRTGVNVKGPEKAGVDVYGPANCIYRHGEPPKRAEKPKPAESILLPVRVHDASHGIAVWGVDKQLVQEELDLRRHNRLRAWDMGGSRSPMALFMTQHREGDLGAYDELGLAFFVTPKDDPLAVGMIVVHDILATENSLGLAASNQIWAARKIPAELTFERQDRSATIAASKDGEHLITVTMPRGGDGTSSEVPLFLYTYKGETLHRTIITRSGTGESMRAGGVGLSIDVSAAGYRHKLCDDLRRFGITGEGRGPLVRPLFTAWSEHVAASLPRPDPVHEHKIED